MSIPQPFQRMVMKRNAHFECSFSKWAFRSLLIFNMSIPQPKMREKVLAINMSIPQPFLGCRMLMKWLQWLRSAHEMAIAAISFGLRNAHEMAIAANGCNGSKHKQPFQNMSNGCGVLMFWNGCFQNEHSAAQNERMAAECSCWALALFLAYESAICFSNENVDKIET